MSTGSKFANITQQKLLGYRDLNDRFLQYLQQIVRESHERVWDEPAVHDVPLVLEADGVGAIRVTGTSISADGQGRLLRISDALVNDGITFENTNAIDYYVALKYTDVPEEIDINPRTGTPEYRNWKEEIGVKAVPDSVTDNGNGTITFQVDSVTEAGVSNAGRQVMVYKLIAAQDATTFGVAVETCTVAWTGSQNEITTTAALGQTTVSTTAADYNVVLLGPTIKRYVDLRSTDGYVFLGIVTGNAGTPTTFDMTDQQLASISLSQLAHVASKASNDRLKIDVRPISGEEGIPQITTRDENNNSLYSIDERGIIARTSYPINDSPNNTWRNPTWGSGEGVIRYSSMPVGAKLKTGGACIVNGKRKIIYIDSVTNVAYKFDVESMSYEDSSDLTSNLNPSYTWYIISSFGEGTYLYVHATDGAGRINIQCIDVSTWNTRSTWPATGKLSTGGQSIPAFSFGRMIQSLNKDWLIYLVGGRSGGVNSLSKEDGVTTNLNINNSKGNWDVFDAGTFHYEDIGMCLDGVYAYVYAQYYASGVGYLSSIDTTPWFGASSAIGCPGSGHPPSVGSAASDTRKALLEAVGNRIVASQTGGSIALFSPNMSIKIANCLFTSYIGPLDAISDGRCIWMKVGVPYSGGSTYVPALFKFDPHKIYPNTGPATRTVSDLENYGDTFILDENESADVQNSEYNENSMIYDGNDIFLAANCGAITPSNQYIYRFRNALYR